MLQCKNILVDGGVRWIEYHETVELVCVLIVCLRWCTHLSTRRLVEIEFTAVGGAEMLQVEISVAEVVHFFAELQYILQS